MSFLKQGESILFTASYNLSDNNIVGIINTFPVKIDKITNSSNVMAVQSNSCNLKNSSTIYLLENYTLSSFKNNNTKKLDKLLGILFIQMENHLLLHYHLFKNLLF